MNISSRLVKKIILRLLVFSFFINPAFFVYASGSSPSNEKEVKEELSKILSSFETENKRRDNMDFISMLREKLREFLRDLFEKLNIERRLNNALSEASIPPGTFFILKIAAIALIIAVILLLGYFIIRSFRFSRKVMMDDDMEIINTIKDPDVLMKKVDECLSVGDYNQALRFLYIAMLINLNKLNIIKINKSKTNKQYLLEIQANRPQIYETALLFTHDFNKYWYGGRNLDRSRFDSWYNTYNQLIGEEGHGLDRQN